VATVPKRTKVLAISAQLKRCPGGLRRAQAGCRRVPWLVHALQGEKPAARPGRGASFTL
jgi:hypothetical protein